MQHFKVLGLYALNIDYTNNFILLWVQKGVKVILWTNGCNDSLFIDQLALNGVALFQHVERVTLHRIQKALKSCNPSYKHKQLIIYSETTLDDINLLSDLPQTSITLQYYSYPLDAQQEQIQQPGEQMGQKHFHVEKYTNSFLMEIPTQTDDNLTILAIDRSEPAVERSHCILKWVTIIILANISHSSHKSLTVFKRHRLQEILRAKTSKRKVDRMIYYSAYYQSMELRKYTTLIQLMIHKHLIVISKHTF